MSTKGKDVCLWLFCVLLLCAFARETARYVIFLLMIGAAFGYVYYRCWYLPCAARQSRRLGLRMVILLPVCPLWARALLWLDGESLYSKRVYEVHLVSGKRSLGEYLEIFAADLEFVKSNFPGCLFLWESSVPLPLLVRRLLRGESSFIKKGGWPIPAFPFTATEIERRRLKHGAILNKKEEI